MKTITMLDDFSHDEYAKNIQLNKHSKLSRFLLEDHLNRMDRGIFISNRIIRNMILHFINEEKYKICAFLKTKLKPYIKLSDLKIYKQTRKRKIKSIQ